MSYNLNSLKGLCMGTTIGGIKRDIRSLDCSSYDGFAFKALEMGFCGLGFRVQEVRTV